METPGLVQVARLSPPLVLSTLPPLSYPTAPSPSLFFLAKTHHRHHHTRKEINK